VCKVGDNIINNETCILRPFLISVETQGKEESNISNHISNALLNFIPGQTHAAAFLFRYLFYN